MANTYTQLHIQLVFAVKYRQALIDPSWKDELYKYITGIIQSNGHKMLRINGTADHIHILIGMRPKQAIAALVQNVKTESSKWIKSKRFCKIPFAWQEGYGAFSYSKPVIHHVIDYINNQEAHHKKISFGAEYRALLTEQGIDHEERFLFTDPE